MSKSIFSGCSSRITRHPQRLREIREYDLAPIHFRRGHHFQAVYPFLQSLDLCANSARCESFLSSGYGSTRQGKVLLMRIVQHRIGGLKCVGLEGAVNEKPKDYYRVFAPGVPNVRVISERFTSEADAKRYKRE